MPVREKYLVFLLDRIQKVIEMCVFAAPKQYLRCEHVNMKLPKTCGMEARKKLSPQKRSKNMRV